MSRTVLSSSCVHGYLSTLYEPHLLEQPLLVPALYQIRSAIHSEDSSHCMSLLNKGIVPENPLEVVQEAFDHGLTDVAWKLLSMARDKGTMWPQKSLFRDAAFVPMKRSAIANLLQSGFFPSSNASWSVIELATEEGDKVVTAIITNKTAPKGCGFVCKSTWSG